MHENDTLLTQSLGRRSGSLENNTVKPIKNKLNNTTKNIRINAKNAPVYTITELKAPL